MVGYLMILSLHVYAESDSERILKIGQHLLKLWTIKYRVVFFTKHGVCQSRQQRSTCITNINKYCYTVRHKWRTVWYYGVYRDSIRRIDYAASIGTLYRLRVIFVCNGIPHPRRVLYIIGLNSNLS